DPVSVTPFVASSGISPTGMCHLSVPAATSIAVIDVHGGAIADMPCVVTMNPSPLVYGIDPSYCGTELAGSDSLSSDGQSFDTTYTMPLVGSTAALPKFEPPLLPGICIVYLSVLSGVNIPSLRELLMSSRKCAFSAGSSM